MLPEIKYKNMQFIISFSLFLDVLKTEIKWNKTVYTY